jgi:hypothetical protein
MRTVVALATLLVTSGVSAAPEFVVSGRLSELDATILAADADGPVSALDTLFYLDIARHPAAQIPVAYWLNDGGTRTPDIERRILDGVEEYLAARSLARQTPPVELPDFLERRHLYSAAEAAWIETVVVPEIVVEDEDINYYYIARADQYTSLQQAQVRYIFFQVPESASAAESSRRHSELETLRDRILAGDLTFDTAARLYSDAPSREQGGLIPPFPEGEYFQEFERNAVDLRKIGDMSPVFLGPEGAYMVQLVSESADPVRIPVDSVADEIRSALRAQHVRPYYTTLYGKLGQEYRRENFASLWEYIDENSPVARVRKTDLTRDQLLRINPSIVNARYDIEGGVLLTEVNAWLEGETVLQEMERLEQTEHRMISKARRISNTYEAAQKSIRDRIDLTKMDSPRSALDTLRSLSPVASGVPETHVVMISLQPDDTDPGAISRRAIQSDIIQRLSETVVAGYLPTRPEPTEFSTAMQTAAAQDDESVADLTQAFNEQLQAAPWPDARIRVLDLGWVEALPGLSRHPAIPALAPGEMSAPQPLGAGVSIYFAGAVRSAESTAWLDYPLVLQVAAYEVEARRLMREEIGRVRQEQGVLALP